MSANAPGQESHHPLIILAPPVPADLPLELQNRPEWLDPTALGSAYRIAHYWSEELAYITNVGWYRFVGTHWEWCAEESARAIAAGIHAKYKAEILVLHTEIARLSRLSPHEASLGPVTVSRCEAQVKRLVKAASACQSEGHARGALNFARSLLRADLDSFDADPHALNAANGTVRFVVVDGEWVTRLDSHRPADRITRICSANYDPVAASDEWQQQLARALPHLDERAYSQRALGYCALGLTDEQVCFFWQGKGRDGKSTTTNVVREVLGSYGATANVNSFLEQKNAGDGNSASPEMASLAGDTRFVSVAEPPSNAKLDETRIKTVTGGGDLRARKLYQDTFQFRPKFKVILECNSKPKIAGPDDGIWRRIHLLLWRSQVAEHEIDRDLPARILRCERDGVLAWIVRGALDYLRSGGLKPPLSVRGALIEYRQVSNAEKAWLMARTIRDENAVTLVSALFSDYKAWCDFEDKHPITGRSFSSFLSDEQIEPGPRVPNNGRYTRKGVRLLPVGEVNADVVSSPDPGSANDNLSGPLASTNDGEVVYKSLVQRDG